MTGTCSITILSKTATTVTVSSYCLFLFSFFSFFISFAYLIWYVLSTSLLHELCLVFYFSCRAIVQRKRAVTRLISRLLDLSSTTFREIIHLFMYKAAITLPLIIVNWSKSLSRIGAIIHFVLKVTKNTAENYMLSLTLDDFL